MKKTDPVDVLAIQHTCPHTYGSRSRYPPLGFSLSYPSTAVSFCYFVILILLFLSLF